VDFTFPVFRAQLIGLYGFSRTSLSFTQILIWNSLSQNNNKKYYSSKDPKLINKKNKICSQNNYWCKTQVGTLERVRCIFYHKTVLWNSLQSIISSVNPVR